MPVHVEREVGERAEALRGEVAGVQVVDELPCRAFMSASVAQISCSRSSVLVVEAHRRRACAAVVGDMLCIVEQKSATKPEPRRVDLGVGLADLQHLGRVRADRRVDLLAELEVELLGDRQQPAEQLGLGALDAHQREAERRARCGTARR